METYLKISRKSIDFIIKKKKKIVILQEFVNIFLVIVLIYIFKIEANLLAIVLFKAKNIYVIVVIAYKTHYKCRH